MAVMAGLKVMPHYDIVVALPTTDRARAFAFAQALGFETPGELAEDGVPNHCGCSSTSGPQ